MMAATGNPRTQIEQPLALKTRVRAIPAVLEQAVSDAAMLYESRVDLLTQPAAVTELYQLDNRLDACLDILRIHIEEFFAAGKISAVSSPGDMFLATVLVLEHRNTQLLKRLLSFAEAEPAMQPALLDAFTWVPLSFTQPLIPHLLGASATFYRLLGLHICRQHQLAADTELERAVTQPDCALQIMALNAIGEIGLLDLLPQCQNLLQSTHDEVRFAAARTCLALGDRSRVIPVLKQFAQNASSFQQAAVSLLAAFLPLEQAQPLLSALARQGYDRRLLVQLAGELGDPANIPALLRLMSDPALSRIAGHAFATITGLDLEEQNLDRPAPADVNAGPSDNPDDEDVAPDLDQALPWPDQAKLAQWWEGNASRFTPGMRFTKGEGMTREQCLQVLQSGDLSQRRLAALLLKAMEPASPQFLLDAPAWRQQARLDGLMARG